MILRRFFTLTALLFSVILVLNCSGDKNNGNGGEIDPGLDPNRDDLGLDNAILIQFKDGKATIDNPYKNNVTITPNGEHVVVQNSSTTTEYNLVVSGATNNGSVKFYSDGDMGVYLNGVKITNPKGPAINIQKGRMSVFLVGGTTSELADGAHYDPTGMEDAKGTFFSEKRVSFLGSGSLEVRAKYNHAIVVDNDIIIKSGNIRVVEAANDCIHANDIIRIEGGTLNLKCVGDAIQNEALPIHISGGNITAETTGIKSHGISNADSLIISGDAVIKLVARGNGSKGISSDGFVLISGGDTKIETHGRLHINDAVPPDTNSATGIKIKDDIEITGGKLKVETTGTRMKGINTEGNFKMSGGELDIAATDDGIKVHNNLSISGGKLTIKARDVIDCDEEAYTCSIDPNVTVNFVNTK